MRIGARLLLRPEAIHLMNSDFEYLDRVMHSCSRIFGGEKCNECLDKRLCVYVWDALVEYTGKPENFQLDLTSCP